MRTRIRSKDIVEQRWYSVDRRGGFTLIEILISMVILLILSALLLGGVMLAIARVRQAQQLSEIEQISMALDAFKQKYGIYPPSRIRLREWNPASPNVANAYNLQDPFDVHSVGYLKKLWPNIKLPILNTTGTLSEAPDAGSPLHWFVSNTNRDGTNPQLYEMEGDECLVFFLGGVAEEVNGKFILHGFTSEPKNPSRAPNANQPVTQSNRVASLFNFDPGRLYIRPYDDPTQVQQSRAGACEAGGNDFFPTIPSGSRLPKMPSFQAVLAKEPRRLPIAYFSAYEGRGYRPDDINIPPASGGVAAEQTINFQIVWPRVTGIQNAPAQPSLGPNPYCENSSNPALSAGTLVKCYRSQGFQLIAPGTDGEFGGGGNQGDYTTSGASWFFNEDNVANFAEGTIKNFLSSEATKN